MNGKVVPLKRYLSPSNILIKSTLGVIEYLRLEGKMSREELQDLAKAFKVGQSKLNRLYVQEDVANETLETEEGQPTRITRMRKLSDSIVQSKIKPKILFAPSTHFGERKRRKERREEKKSLMMRNFRYQGKKVVNLGDMELTQPLEPLPEHDWLVEVTEKPG